MEKENCTLVYYKLEITGKSLEWLSLPTSNWWDLFSAIGQNMDGIKH